LEGSQSVLVIHGNSKLHAEGYIFGNITTAHFYFEVLVGTIGTSGDPSLFHVDDQYQNEIVEICYHTSTGHYFTLWHPSNTFLDTTFTMVEGTKYYIWLDVTRNGTVAMYISETPTKPNSATKSYTDTLGYYPGLFALAADDGGHNIFDHIRVSTYAIGSNPP
jgi:hypothetical protein